ncbi:MAG: hypothetical protein ACTH54_09890 [Vagococcus salmoninarum]|uniref:hypothetical protein n=1 Tax=Vagococcus salmoninarum TaxID=2739 RepID=UPI003F9E4C6A
MPDIMKMKLNDVEVYPQTHADAVLGIDEKIDEKITGIGQGEVTSVNKKTGAVVLTAEDVQALPNTTNIPVIPGVATETAIGLMSAVDKKKLDGFSGITFEKVGSV